MQNNWTHIYIFLKINIFTSSYFSSLHVAFDVWKPVLLALLHREFWIGFGSDARGSAIANYQPNCHLPNQPPPPSPISTRQQLWGKSAAQTTFKSAPASAVELQPYWIKVHPNKKLNNVCERHVLQESLCKIYRGAPRVPSNAWIVKQNMYFCCKIDFHKLRVLHNHTSSQNAESGLIKPTKYNSQHSTTSKWK